MLGTHQVWRVSAQTVMQDQGVARPKLYCLKPSFLALTRRGTRNLNETGTEEVYRSHSRRRLYSLTASQRIGRCVKETNGSLNHSHMQEDS